MKRRVVRALLAVATGVCRSADLKLSRLRRVQTYGDFGFKTVPVADAKFPCISILFLARRFQTNPPSDVWHRGCPIQEPQRPCHKMFFACKVFTRTKDKLSLSCWQPAVDRRSCQSIGLQPAVEHLRSSLDCNIPFKEGSTYPYTILHVRSASTHPQSPLNISDLYLSGTFAGPAHVDVRALASALSTEGHLQEDAEHDVQELEFSASAALMATCSLTSLRHNPVA
eukprot:2102520-Amphidinium_carterae.1